MYYGVLWSDSGFAICQIYLGVQDGPRIASVFRHSGVECRWVAHVPNIAGGSSARSPGQKGRDRSSMQKKESMKESAEEHDDMMNMV